MQAIWLHKLFSIIGSKTLSRLFRSLVSDLIKSCHTDKQTAVVNKNLFITLDVARLCSQNISVKEIGDSELMGFHESLRTPGPDHGFDRWADIYPEACMDGWLQRCYWNRLASAVFLCQSSAWGWSLPYAGLYYTLIIPPNNLRPLETLNSTPRTLAPISGWRSGSARNTG